MRALLKTHWFSALAAAFTTVLATALAWAQDPTTTTESTSRTETVTSWWVEPWVWGVVIGVAVFLIVVIALTNRGGTRST